MLDEGLHLGTSDRIEQWVACKTGLIDVQDGEYLAQLAFETVRLLEMWHAEGDIPSIICVPDLAWALHTFSNMTDTAQLMAALAGPLRVSVHNEIDQNRLWASNPGGLHIDAVRSGAHLLRKLWPTSLLLT